MVAIPTQIQAVHPSWTKQFKQNFACPGMHGGQQMKKLHTYQ
jgi:hypothetical protein